MSAWTLLVEPVPDGSGIDLTCAEISLQESVIGGMCLPLLRATYLPAGFAGTGRGRTFFLSWVWAAAYLHDVADQGIAAVTLIVVDVTYSHSRLLVRSGVRRRQGTECFVNSRRTSSNRTVDKLWLRNRNDCTSTPSIATVNTTVSCHRHSFSCGDRRQESSSLGRPTGASQFFSGS